MTMVAALAAGMLLGCKPQGPATPAPTPAPLTTVKPAHTVADDELSNSAPPSTATPMPRVALSTPAPRATSQPSGATRKYVVKAQDGLMGIARSQLGNASRWKEIPPLNPGMDATNPNLKVGQEILIPAK
jgi:hypothetical protein